MSSFEFTALRVARAPGPFGDQKKTIRSSPIRAGKRRRNCLCYHEAKEEEEDGGGGSSKLTREMGGTVNPMNGGRGSMGGMHHTRKKREKGKKRERARGGQWYV